MNTILVQMADRQWTMQAMHLACAVARNTHSNLVLLHLRRVSPVLLGYSVGTGPLAAGEYDDLHEHEMIAEDYGVVLTIQPMQYESLSEALVQAAACLQASIVFARLPHRSWWYRWQRWNLRRRLSAHQCRLYTLDQTEPVEALTSPLHAGITDAAHHETRYHP